MVQIAKEKEQSCLALPISNNYPRTIRRDAKCSARLPTGVVALFGEVSGGARELPALVEHFLVP